MAVERIGTLDGFKKMFGEDNIEAYTHPYVGSDSDTYLEEMLDVGSEYVAGYLSAYDPSTLDSSAMMRRVTYLISGWLLSKERDNPPHFVSGVQWAFDTLERIKRGDLQLTDAVRSDNGPAVLNFRYEPLNPTFPVLPDWYATSPHNLPSDRYHGIWNYSPIAAYFW